MEAGFWLERWKEGRTRFHRDEVMPLLRQHWPALALPAGCRVFVPLAGKSLDMLWLAEQGHAVLGAELSPLAVAQFFDENQLQPAISDEADGRHHRAGPIDLVCGDVFELDAAALAGCTAVYDRAALIALPADMRRRYVSEVYGRLPLGCQALLITLEYPQAEKAGPPFRVDVAEVEALFAPQWSIEELDRRDILAQEPAFQEDGVTALSTAVYRLQRKA
ncbi:thiopurine S-methyltransferase [Pseudoxanthomonas indica]|nr:thiopurine S-methyltransferase [Pseudoxanthomonas indica]